jgi:hypothetical protein
MVGHQALDLIILVRVQASQPKTFVPYAIRLGSFGICPFS